MLHFPFLKKTHVGAGRFTRPVEVFVNPLAGSAGPRSPEEMALIFEEAETPFNLTTASPEDLEPALREMVARKPELLVVLAGDGTAGLAASLCGTKGPMVAPLPGGTMNVLPRAIYGESDWRSALKATLDHGVERPVGGGEIEGRRFYVAAMLGSAAAFAPAREAVRRHRIAEGCRKAGQAWNRAFTGRLRFAIERDPEHKALALALICPLISRKLAPDDEVLEAVAFDPHGPLEALRVAGRVALSPVLGDWRVDSAVEAGPARTGLIRSWRGIPALLDGEPVKLSREARFRFLPTAFRAFAPPPPEPDPESGSEEPGV